MDAHTAREMALDMPGTAMKERYGRPSYSVKKKTYMTVWPDEQRAMIKLTLRQQADFCEAHPDAFVPTPNKRGPFGWTDVNMDQLSDRLFRYVIDLAWRNVAPKWILPTRQPPPKG